jgi:hypothetical protein
MSEATQVNRSFKPSMQAISAADEQCDEAQLKIRAVRTTS